RACTESCPASIRWANPLTAGVLQRRAELPTRWGRLGRSRPAHLARPEARGPRRRLVVKPDDVLLQRVAAGVAGRVAEHLGRLHALVANALLGQRLEARDAHALQVEDRLLGLRPAATVVADVAVGADHPVARDEVRNGVVG